MSKFRYAYQKIADLKTSEKTQAEWLLSSAVGKLHTEEDSLNRLYQERFSWGERLQSASANAVSLSELVLMQGYVEHLDICITRKQNDVKAAQQEVDNGRTVLSDKMKDEKVWQKSKEHAFNRFRAVMQVKEQNELDDIATTRFMFSAT
jgi:flagellar FliJ protein